MKKKTNQRKFREIVKIINIFILNGLKTSKELKFLTFSIYTRNTDRFRSKKSVIKSFSLFLFLFNLLNSLFFYLVKINLHFFVSN